MHPAPEPRIEVPLEQIWRLHDVHVTVDEPEPILHDTLLAWLSTPRAPLPCTPRPSGILLGRRLRRYARCRASSAGFARAIPPSGEVRKGAKPLPSLISPQLAVVCIGIVVAALFLADRPCVLRAPLEGAGVRRGIVGSSVSLARFGRREANLPGGAARCRERHRQRDPEESRALVHIVPPCSSMTFGSVRRILPHGADGGRANIRRHERSKPWRRSSARVHIATRWSTTGRSCHPARSSTPTWPPWVSTPRTACTPSIAGGIPWWCSTARATSSAPGARASSIAPTASTWPPTTRSGSPTMATTPCATARWTAASFSPLASRGSPRPT